MFSWPLGAPGWRLAELAGVPIRIEINAFRDEEAGVYVAVSRHVKGLAVESETLDGLKAEIDAAVPVLLNLDYQPLRQRPHTEIRIEDCAALAT